MNAVRMRFELLLMELGDFGGGVGVLLRDGDSLRVETSKEKGQGLMALLRDSYGDKENSIDSMLAST